MAIEKKRKEKKRKEKIKIKANQQQQKNKIKIKQKQKDRKTTKYCYQGRASEYFYQGCSLLLVWFLQAAAAHAEQLHRKLHPGLLIIHFSETNTNYKI